jgi:uncharacterized damage-inducible protein DinB
MYALSPEELLNYCSEETTRWREWFRANPAAGGLAANIAGSGNVREVVLHIAAVELRYAERLLEQPATDFAQLASQTMDEVFSIFARSQDYMREFLSQVKEEDWGKVITFETRSAGTLSASKRKVFVHAVCTACATGHSSPRFCASRAISKAGPTTSFSARWLNSVTRVSFAELQNFFKRS